MPTVSSLFRKRCHHLPLGRLNRMRREIYRHVQKPQTAKLPHDAPTNMKVAVVGVPADLEQPWNFLIWVIRSPSSNAPVHWVARLQQRSLGWQAYAGQLSVLSKAQWPNLISLLDALDVEPESHGQSEDWMDSPFVGWWRWAGKG